MRILNADARADLAAGRTLSLNIGCGNRAVAGHYGVDQVGLPGVDILADLEKPLDALPDDSVARVYCRHTLEHVSNFLPLMAELHRIVAPGGTLDITVPHFSNPYGYSDPTHVRFFGLYSFYYFCDEADQPRRKVPGFYIPQRFRVESVSVRMLKESVWDKAVRTVVEPLINRSVAGLDWYERRLCRTFPANEIRYVLRPLKRADSIAKAA